MSQISNEEAVPKTGPQNSLERFLLDLLETVALAVVLFLAINIVTARVRVDGSSMRPTLENGELVLVNRLAYKFDPPMRGDIIVFRSVNTPDDLIKRVVGLPGETVRVEGGQVFINDAPLNEPYIAASPIYTGVWSVPEGYLFVLGDNRNDSSDSHSWGLLPMENIIGKAVMVYWPFSDFTIIQHERSALASP